MRDPSRSDGGGPKGLGGWLVLPLLGLFVTPVLTLVQLVDYADMVEFWPLLTGGQQIFFAFELAGNVLLLLLAPALLLVFMFRRLEVFPGRYVIWLLALPVFFVADMALGYLLFPDVYTDGEARLDRESLRGLFRSLVMASIWVPYMILSRRVANTFAN